MTTNSILELTVKNVYDQRLKQHPLRIAIPLAIGSVQSCCSFTMHPLKSEQIVTGDISINSTHSDGSIAWLTVDIEVDLEPHSAICIAVHAIQQTNSPNSLGTIPAKEIEAPNRLASTVRTTSGPLQQSYSLRASISICGVIKQIDFNQVFSDVLTASNRQVFTYHESVTSLAGTLNLELVAGSLSSGGLLNLELRVHNPAAAKHKDGLWDLGDPASILIDFISLEILSNEGGTASIQIDSNHLFDITEFNENLVIHQSSSGGMNSNSTVHIDRDRSLPFSTEGYTLMSNVRGLLKKGARANSPIALLKNAESIIALRFKGFWEEFPSRLEIGPGRMVAHFFPKLDSGFHELQGGEQKRRSVTIGIGEQAKQSLSAPTPQCSVKRINPKPLSYADRALKIDGSLDKRILEWIVSPAEFFAKREKIDEYGWRNFGDVFADHESLYQADEEQLLTSHYNNQYDLILGFGLQYLRTLDSDWFSLMNDLARHVVDIDIYHTTDDRHEYNQGMFWHTNHYEDAHTSTHRTFSRENYDPLRPAAGSGGPGSEHCYTTGLALHYRLTGDTASRKTVIELARWMIALHDGAPTLLGQLHLITRRELSALIAKTRNQRGALATMRHPFTRGTGNYVIALLDAFDLTKDNYWLRKTELVLRNTFHESDDVALCDLLNIELRWSYTVFLQAAVRYIFLKESMDNIDETYSYVRRALVTYFRWMAENETPYLEHPERLEFPNETWVAQDLRKHHLLNVALRLDPEYESKYIKLIARIEQHIINNLASSKTRNLARIQALLALHCGLSSHILQLDKEAPNIQAHPAEPLVIPSSSFLIKTAAQKIISRIRAVRPSEEWKWLQHRLNF